MDVHKAQRQFNALMSALRRETQRGTVAAHLVAAIEEHVTALRRAEWLSGYAARKVDEDNARPHVA